MQRTVVLVIVAIVIVGTTAFISDKSLGITSGKAAGQLIHAQTEEFCGTKVDSDTSTELAKTESARKRFLANKQAPPTSLVNVHFHVIQSADAGAIDDANIALQMDVLNYSFSGHGLSFLLATVERISNNGWFQGCDAGPEKKMKRALHIGTATDLNVYICEPTKFLGRGTFPWLYAKSPELDGVTLHHSVFAGGSDPNFNTGEVLVHETGHWLGLFHTFQGGCTEPGDEVDDTPAEFAFSFAACPIGRDTCPSPGLDPTDNFMDYSGDACWTNFTAGQNDRMASMFAIYRFGQ